MIPTSWSTSVFLFTSARTKAKMTKKAKAPIERGKRALNRLIGLSMPASLGVPGSTDRARCGIDAQDAGMPEGLARDFDPVAAGLQLVDQGFSGGLVNQQASELRRRLTEGAEEMPRAKTDYGHRLGRRQPKINVVEDHLKGCLVLAITAGNAHGKHWLSLLQDESGC